MPLKATLGGETAAGGGGLLTPTIEPQLQIIFFLKFLLPQILNLEHGQQSSPGSTATLSEVVLQNVRSPSHRCVN